MKKFSRVLSRKIKDYNCIVSILRSHWYDTDFNMSVYSFNLEYNRDILRYEIMDMLRIELLT